MTECTTALRPEVSYTPSTPGQGKKSGDGTLKSIRTSGDHGSAAVSSTAASLSTKARSSRLLSTDGCGHWMQQPAKYCGTHAFRPTPTYTITMAPRVIKGGKVIIGVALPLYSLNLWNDFLN